MIRRLGAVVGVAAIVTLSACSNAVTGSPAAGGGGAEGGSDSSNPSQDTGFDECALLEPTEVAEWIGTEEMYPTSADVVVGPDGSRRATCTYFPQDVPGMIGMKLTVVTDVDPATYFESWERNYKNRLPLEIGDRAEAVSLGAEGIETKIFLVHSIKGNTGLELFYTFNEDGTSAMPVVEKGAEKFGKVLNTAFERLPEELDIPDGKPEGSCADIDLDLLSETLGAELSTARTTTGANDAIDCTFGGESGYVSISLLTEQSMVDGQGAKPEDVTHDDIADGARIRINQAGEGEPQGQLDARANVGDNVVAIQASYGDDVSGITEPRPEDVELVRAIVEAVGGQD